MDPPPPNTHVHPPVLRSRTPGRRPRTPRLKVGPVSVTSGGVNKQKACVFQADELVKVAAQVWEKVPACQGPYRV